MSRSDTLGLPNRQTLRISSLVTRSRLQVPQKWCVMLVMHPTPPRDPGTCAAAVSVADIAVLAVPYAEEEGPIALKVANWLGNTARKQVRCRRLLLGDRVRIVIVSAFQNTPTHRRRNLPHRLNRNVLVYSDDDSACEIAGELASPGGIRAEQASPLANSVAAEALTFVLILINRRYGIARSGI
ncbi:hypothetical protein QBC33DRAFT_564318 [Phialemonium atrogriseum]|uniref:Uncharacterized protein n=1 Tax=Phialemonium atrogriseum TaxID=1093897 RepID=A0AAJ0BR45_9PEZI|nr:uncharacterized protein QBC33DRAFT_564318 [Phialemonium atrogriseum]KAK1761868.1 hypothetical protein QBC33DRAFT_564318 [Phialemonium atrogriseum]